jgi:hypothetical protein
MKMQANISSRIGRKALGFPRKVRQPLATQAPPTGFSIADEIAKLKKLTDEGILTNDEFAAKKKQLLGI